MHVTPSSLGAASLLVFDSEANSFCSADWCIFLEEAATADILEPGEIQDSHEYSTYAQTTPVLVTFAPQRRYHFD